MPRAAAGSAKAVSNAMKARGLTKLRFYCQICQKANRDENGYKCHIESESHLRKVAALGPGAAAGKAGGVINDYSKEFQDAFVALLSRRFGTRRIKANKVYQEYIQDRHHLHMNATRWLSLTEFVKHLGREGIVHVDETEGEGWFISWIDNSPAALARQDALGRMNRAKMNDEQRERKLLQEQMQRAQAEARASGADPSSSAAASHAAEDTTKATESAVANGSTTDADEGAKSGLLQRPPDAAPLKLGISLRASSSSPSGASLSTTDPAAAQDKAAHTPIQLGLSKPPSLTNVFRVTAASSLSKPPASAAGAKTLPPTNVFKKALPSTSSSAGASSSTPASISTSSTSSFSSHPPAPAAQRHSHHQLSAAERLRQEELERKRRIVGPQPGAKRMRL